MAFKADGLNAAVDGIGQISTLYLIAWSGTGGSSIEDTSLVTYDSAVGGVADIAANVTFTLGTGVTVTRVSLESASSGLGSSYAEETLTTDNAFPNGGDLIVTSFELTIV